MLVHVSACDCMLVHGGDAGFSCAQNNNRFDIDSFSSSAVFHVSCTSFAHMLRLLPDLLLLLPPANAHDQHQLQLSSSSALPPPHIASLFTCLRVLTEASPLSLIAALHSSDIGQIETPIGEPISRTAEHEFSRNVGELVQLVCSFSSHFNRLVREDCIAGELQFCGSFSTMLL